MGDAMNSRKTKKRSNKSNNSKSVFGEERIALTGEKVIVWKAYYPDGHKKRK